MREFTIHRSSDVPLIFEGDILATASTHAPSKQRWTECTLYVTSKGGYVSHSVGRSNVSHEIDIISAAGFADIKGAVNFFRDKSGRMSWLTSEIVREASRSFPDIHEQLSERL